MSAKGGRKFKHKSSTRPKKDEQGPPFHDIVESQIGFWKKWNEKMGTDTDQISQEVVPIVAAHWTKMLEQLWHSAIEIQTSEDPVTLQDDLRRRMLIQYNDMMKRIFTTKSFAAKSGSDVDSLLEGVKTWNEIMEETLRAMRMPTRGDIDELHEALYNLNKRIDNFAKSLNNANNAKRRQ